MEIGNLTILRMLLLVVLFELLCAAAAVAQSGGSTAVIGSQSPAVNTNQTNSSGASGSSTASTGGGGSAPATLPPLLSGAPLGGGSVVSPKVSPAQGGSSGGSGPSVPLPGSSTGRGSAASSAAAGASSASAGAAAQPAPVPDSFRGIHLGMSLHAVETALEKDPYFNYQGPPDVSMLANPNEHLIETAGYSYISRAFFQFYHKKLYIMTLMLNPDEISYYTMYTTLTDKYGPSTSLSPAEVVWESKHYRLSLERPLSVKYIDRQVFDRLQAAGKMKQSERSISREHFLNQF